MAYVVLSVAAREWASNAASVVSSASATDGGAVAAACASPPSPRGGFLPPWGLDQRVDPLLAARTAVDATRAAVRRTRCAEDILEAVREEIEYEETAEMTSMMDTQCEVKLHMVPVGIGGVPSLLHPLRPATEAPRLPFILPRWPTRPRNNKRQKTPRLLRGGWAGTTDYVTPLG